MEAVEFIKKQIEENPVVIFMKGTPDFPQCGFSARAAQALAACGEKFTAVNIFENPEVHRALPGYSNWPTFPQDRGQRYHPGIVPARGIAAIGESGGGEGQGLNSDCRERGTS